MAPASDDFSCKINHSSSPLFLSVLSPSLRFPLLHGTDCLVSRARAALRAQVSKVGETWMKKAAVAWGRSVGGAVCRGFVTCTLCVLLLCALAVKKGVAPES